MFPLEAKIMIVDDSSFARGTLKKGLQELKYWKILEAADAKIARELMQEDEQQVAPVHLLITDLQMPDMNGGELLRWVRSQDKMRDLPVIVITGSQDRQEVLAVAKMGISHYLVKPFDNATLREKIASTWAKHGEKYFEALKR